MKSTNSIALAAIFMWVAIHLHAEIVPEPGSQSLPDLLGAASLVFTGEIASVEKKGEVDGNWNGLETRLELFTATAVVDRVYKGQLNVTSTEVLYSRPKGQVCAVSKCYAITSGQYGLFFLKKEADGFHPLDRFSWTFAVSRFKSPAAGFGITGLESDLFAGLRDQDEKRLLANIELIGSLKDVKSVSPLLDLLGSSNSNESVRAGVYVALFRLRNYSKLREALSVVESSSKASATHLRIEDQIYGLVSAIRDPTTMQVLIQYSASPSARVRESVIHALRESRDRDVVPALAKALDDPVQSIRYDAVLGLATIEENWGLAPSFDAFAADEAKYVAAWKSWWLKSGGNQYR